MFLQSAPIIEHFILPPIPFIPMLFPIVMISFLMFKLKDIFIPLLELVPKTINLVHILFNPKKLIDDIIFSVTYSIKNIVNGVIDSIDIGTSSNKEEEPDKIPKVCMPPSLFKLLVLIICPPLALLLNNGGGITGLFLVLVCAILTVWCYYFPGLIFAALHILC